MNPKVSVIMPSFNSSKYIREAVCSVLNQSYVELELLIIDAGSTDGTVELIKQFSTEDNRVKYINNVDDEGPAHARQVGIQKCDGEYIAFLDADDFWLPDKTKKQLNSMQDNKISFSYTGYRSIDEDGENPSCPILMRESYNLKQALVGRGIGILTIMIEKILLNDEIIQTRSDFAEDYLWWLLILKQGHIAKHINIDSARYRKTKNSRSKNRFAHQLSLWNIYRKHVQLSLITAFVYYMIYVINVSFSKMRVALCSRYLNNSV